MYWAEFNVPWFLLQYQIESKILIHPAVADTLPNNVAEIKLYSIVISQKTGNV